MPMKVVTRLLALWLALLPSSSAVFRASPVRGKIKQALAVRSAISGESVAANRFSSVPGTVIHLAASPQSSMRVIGAPAPDAHAVAAMVSAANGGAVAVVEGAAVSASVCH